MKELRTNVKIRKASLEGELNNHTVLHRSSIDGCTIYVVVCADRYQIEMKKGERERGELE